MLLHLVLPVGGHNSPARALHPKRRHDQHSISGVEFIHIPKNAGSAIEALGSAHGHVWGARRAEESWPGKTSIGCSAWHIPRAHFKASGEDPYKESRITFCVVRHPYTRTISEFVFRTAYARPGCTWPIDPLKCDFNATNECTTDRLNSWVIRRLGEVRESMHRAVLSFPSVPAAEYDDEKSWSADDCHWLPQWMYTDTSQRQSTSALDRACKRVLRFETLEAQLPAFFNEVGLGALAKEKLARHHEMEGACKMEPWQLNQTSRDLVDSLYARDFHRFGYAKRASPLRKAEKQGGHVPQKSSREQFSTGRTTPASRRPDQRVAQSTAQHWPLHLQPETQSDPQVIPPPFSPGGAPAPPPKELPNPKQPEGAPQQQPVSESAPSEGAASGKSVPSDAVSSDAVPSNAAPSYTAPSDSLSSNAVQDSTASQGEVSEDEDTPGSDLAVLAAAGLGGAIDDATVRELAIAEDENVALVL